MEPQQALTNKAHLELFQDRLKSLKTELQVAAREHCDTSRELENYRTRWDAIKLDYAKRAEELENTYKVEIQEFKRQIKLAEDTIEKKKEERRSLLEYLNEMNLCEHSFDDLQNFSWEQLKKLELRPRNADDVGEVVRKSRVLANLAEKGEAEVKKLNQLIKAAAPDRERITRKMEETREHLEIWKQMADDQEKQISKMRAENERLNLLIKQCTTTSEPMSEYVTKNVREKCHSFLNSSSNEELLNGLIRYKNRQSRMIKLLKHKDDKLGSDLSVLQIATDQTADLMQYYLNIVQTGRELVLGEDTATTASARLMVPTNLAASDGWDESEIVAR